MIDTKDFKTKTVCIERKNPSVESVYPVAIDIGYSAVKGMSPNKVYSFPSYAKQTNAQILSLGGTNVDSNSIQYKDGVTGATWLVGEAGINSLDSDDTNDSVNSLFGRNRYFSSMFLVIARVGIAMGLLPNSHGGYTDKKKIAIQTGLPPAYMKADEPLIKEALAGQHIFSIKIGNQKWVNFDFTLSENDIKVIPQPMGTLMSVSSLMDGTPVPEAAKYFSKKVHILDGGFGTMDDIDINNGQVINAETFTDFGMKRVMKETSEEIFARYHTDIPVIAMQKYLEDGMIRHFDRKRRALKQVSFTDILETANRNVCMEALNKIDNIYNNFIYHDYFIVAGGTGEAWYPIIRDYFKDMGTLKVIPGNQNDTLPYTFSNVRGYYIVLLKNLQAYERMSKKAQEYRK